MTTPTWLRAGRLVRALPGLVLVVGLLAVAVTADDDAGGRAVTITPAKCSMMGGIVPRPAERGEVEAIELSCGGSGIRGAVGGSRVAIPNRGYWAGDLNWGRAGQTYVAKVAALAAMSTIAAKALTLGVPWPRSGSRRARDNSLYHVYQIYTWTSTIVGPVESVFKYGITKVGRSRPASQLSRCRRVMGAEECRWSWLRTNVRGWLRARKIEAIYAMRYKSAYGHCPPGMTRCL